MAQPQHEPFPPRHGRRLIQMLFRSNQEGLTVPESPNRELDARWEEHAASNGSSELSKTPQHGDNRGQDHSPLPPIDRRSGKFSALKRKLFPSTQRRPPARVPALLPISPISTNATDFSGPYTGDADAVVAFDGGDDNDGAASEGNNSSLNPLKAHESIGTSKSAPMVPESRHSARTDKGQDDDDCELEFAVEVVDLESSNNEDTLAEMTKAIDDVRLWKQQHDQQTHQLMKQAENTAASLRIPTNSDDDNSTIAQVVASYNDEREREREARQQSLLPLLQAAEAYAVEPVTSLCPALDEADITRIAEALHREIDTESDTLSRLRDELFQLEVKERHAEMQAAMLQELETADSDLDMKIVDVEAFTSALDSVLAQFDAANA